MILETDTVDCLRVTPGDPRAQRPGFLPAVADGRQQTGPLELADPEGIAGLRQLLEAHGCSEVGLRHAFGVGDGRLSLHTDFPLYLRRLAAPTPSNTLLKLFTLRVPVPEAAARAAVAPFVTLDRLAALGLVAIGESLVSARVALSPCEGLWLAHDFDDSEGANMLPDHVMGIGPATLTLAKLTVPQAAGRVLDVGTGCGVQGLLAARSGGRVIGVDTNPRALNLAAFNARLNRLPNFEGCLGSLFEPVAGLEFDLIICNPPYVISPESCYQFRDSGLPGDRICEQVVQAAPAHLRGGGFACVLCNWTHRKQQDWSEPLRDWVADSGCDALLLHGATHDPLGYAALWTRAADRSRYGQALDRWERHYARLGIEAVSAGAVILRRRTAGQAWVRTDTLPHTIPEACGEHISRRFEAEDWLAAVPQDEDLLARRFRLVDGVCLHHSWQSRHGALAVGALRLELPHGLRSQGAADGSTFQLLALCDGRRPLDTIVTQLARATRTDEAAARLRAAALIRHLVPLGFLAPVDGAAAFGSNSPGGEPGTRCVHQPHAGSQPGARKKGSYE